MTELTAVTKISKPTWWAWLLGRQLLLRGLPAELQTFVQSPAAKLVWPELEIVPGLRCDEQGQWWCQRCQQPLAAGQRLATGQLYCTACLALGRVSQRDQLVRLPSQQPLAVGNPLTWSGRLTTAQQQVATAILAAFAAGKSEQLLWAVTGAGKTEMTFPIIADFLKRGGRVALVAPRIDVGTELYPRLQQAFARTSVTLLHGQTKQPYRPAQLVVATTHQLLRFYQAFDLVIVDEVDAYPYAGNELLALAVKAALKPSGQRLYLSATPPRALRRRAQRDQLPLHYLPRRFHGRDLPMPQVVITPVFKGAQLAPRLARLCRRLLEQQRRCLLFVPQAATLPQYARAWQHSFSQVPVETVHAADPQRLAKVAAFRAGQGQVLLTTTILERGVTLRDIDVVVLAADHPNFSASSLVQIAGRADRAADCPVGQVYFCCEYYDRAIAQACQQIRQLNRQSVTASWAAR